MNTSEACYQGGHEHCTTGDAWIGRCECPCHDEDEEDDRATEEAMADDPLTAELDRIAENHRQHVSAGFPEPGICVSRCSGRWPCEAYRSVAALRAVLELHQPADRGAGAQCKGCATHVTFTRWPCPTYLAITRELAGGSSNAR